MAERTRGYEEFRSATEGKTDEEIAQELSTESRRVTQPVVNRWRNEKRTPELWGLLRIQDVYGVGVELWNQSAEEGDAA